jgi:inner membrane transporter RhtA
MEQRAGSRYLKQVTSTCRTASDALADRLPPHLLFVIGAVFHYLGPSFAVLLFERLDPLGVAWLRIASAALLFGLWRRPWRIVPTLLPRQRAAVLALGAVIAAMNASFYLAIDALPLGTVGAIEFLGPIGLAAWGVGTLRNGVALTSAVAGVAILTHLRVAAAEAGYVFAFANCLLFVLYIVLGHRISGSAGIDLLACAMGVAAIVALPFGFRQAQPAFGSISLLAAATGVGIASSLVPYVTDQLAMARLPRASYALMLSMLPATACLIGFLVLRQIPSTAELFGIALVGGGVLLHRSKSEEPDA